MTNLTYQETRKKLEELEKIHADDSEILGYLRNFATFFLGEPAKSHEKKFFFLEKRLVPVILIGCDFEVIFGGPPSYFSVKCLRDENGLPDT